MKNITIMLVSLFMLLGLIGCGSGGGGSSYIPASSNDTTEEGSLEVNLTDAPLVDEDNVTGVFITVTEVQYHGTGGWNTLSDFNTSLNPINLLDLQDGKVLSLGSTKLPSGKYTQLRFLLEAAEEKQVPKSNTGCFIQFDGDRNETLYVPSGSTSGYKAIGNFDVPVNAPVTVTADFDVRKSITVTGGSSYYKLKPTIRLVVNNQAGTIKGNISNLDSTKTYLIFAYETPNNIVIPDEESNDFADAVTSTTVKDNGSYTLAFLAEGTYDLVTVEYDNNGDYTNEDDIQLNVGVVSEQTTNYNFSF